MPTSRPEGPLADLELRRYGPTDAPPFRELTA